MPPRRRAEPSRTASSPRRAAQDDARAQPGRLRSFAGRHRVLATFLVVLAVLVAGAAVAVPVLDGVARDRAADRIASQVQAELGLRSPPAVQIGGTWFLWQAARGHYDGATIRTARLTYEGVELGATQVRLRDVAIPPSVLLGRPGTVTVGGGTVRTLAPWALMESEAAKAAGSDVTMRRDGKRIVATTDLAGVPLKVLLSPRVTKKAIVLRPTGVKVAGRELDVEAASNLADRFGLGGTADSLLTGFSYDLGEVSDRFQVRTATVGRDGLVVGGALEPLELAAGG